MKKFTLLFVLTAILLNYNTASAENKLKVYTGDSVHISLGVPIDNDASDDYFLLRPQYALSYNNSKGVPNWVSYELNADWFGDVARYSGNFITDTSLPVNFVRVKHSDYTNTGFDRGHLVRSEERTKTVEDNKSTFILTNIIPQRPDVNRGPWLDFEYYCENLCKKENKQLYIITGPVHSECHIDTNYRVSFPQSCFKIVVVLDKNQNINNIDHTTNVVAILIPNDIGVKKDKWGKFRTSIRKIEQITGYNFLSNLPKNLQDILENKIE